VWKRKEEDFFFTFLVEPERQWNFSSGGFGSLKRDTWFGVVEMEGMVFGLKIVL
jgi:hypothetical protein